MTDRDKAAMTAIVWILRIITVAGVSLILGIGWDISQQIAIQSVQIENNKAAIEKLIEVILNHATETTPN